MSLCKSKIQPTQSNKKLKSHEESSLCYFAISLMAHVSLLSHKMAQMGMLSGQNKARRSLTSVILARVQLLVDRMGRHFGTQYHSIQVF